MLPRERTVRRASGFAGSPEHDRARRASSACEREISDAVVEDRPLHLLDGLGDLDVAGAGLGAAERRAAAPDAGALVEDVEAVGGGLVAGVEDEAVGVDDG